jgi:hypothetical protein
MQQTTQPRSRPTGITILAVFALIAGILSILVSLFQPQVKAAFGRA